MKTAILLVAVLILAAAAGYIIYKKPESARQIPVLGEQLDKYRGASALYKWQDKEGVWQYSSQPPPEGTAYEIVEYRHDTNVLPAPEKLRKK